MPDEESVSAALQYLAQTDVPLAKAIARCEALELQCKTIRGLEFLEATGTVAEREAKSNSSQTFRAFTNDYENAVADRETMRLKRRRAELTIDVWRTVAANRRQG